VVVPVPVPVPVPVAIQITEAPSLAPVAPPVSCGLFKLSFFCPRPGKCGFWRRTFSLGGC
jgi:hypothetical protein